MIDPFFTISGFPGRNDFLIRQIFTYFIFDWHDRPEVCTIQLGIHEVRLHYVPALYTYQALVTGGCGITAVTRIHVIFIPPGPRKHHSACVRNKSISV
jgi:hypothetical protein